jgi:hypothetical protein
MNYFFRWSTLGIKSVRNDRKYTLSFCIIFLWNLVGNDRKYALSFRIIFYSKTIWKWYAWKRYRYQKKILYIGNEIIRSKMCRYRSITVPQIKNTISNMSDQQSNMNIIMPYAYTITTRDSQLLNSSANKFMSKQPTCRLAYWRQLCPWAGDCEWRPKLYTLGCIIGSRWASVFLRLMGHLLTIWEFRHNFTRKNCWYMSSAEQSHHHFHFRFHQYFPNSVPFPAPSISVLLFLIFFGNEDRLIGNFVTIFISSSLWWMDRMRGIFYI